MRIITKLLGIGRHRDRFIVGKNDRERKDQVYYELSGVRRRAHRTWYRGKHTNFHPVRKSLREPDFFRNYVGKGWLPEKPFIDRNTYITAFGSCFAAEVTSFLFEQGYRVFGRDLNLNAHVVRAGEGIVNTAALRQQFEWAFEGERPSDGMWHDKSGAELAVGADEQDATRAIFQSTGVFIFTLGLSEVWYDKTTGEAFWRGVPDGDFDEERHRFKVLSVAENLENIARVYDIIRQHRPDAAIIFTLSPVPLVATFRPISCVTANSVSKASLRVAVDELMRRHEDDGKLFYFPSYEMVSAVLPDPMEDDLRHPKREVVGRIMAEFKAAFLC